jgi:hypothetical protein
MAMVTSNLEHLNNHNAESPKRVRISYDMDADARSDKTEPPNEEGKLRITSKGFLKKSHAFGCFCLPVICVQIILIILVVM